VYPNQFNPFAGLRVFEDMNALETVGPTRTLEPKRWMSGTRYYARVQKKWIKRWGFEKKPCILQTPRGLFVHPSLMAELKRRAAAPPQGLGATYGF